MQYNILMQPERTVMDSVLRFSRVDACYEKVGFMHTCTESSYDLYTSEAQIPRIAKAAALEAGNKPLVWILGMKGVQGVGMNLLSCHLGLMGSRGPTILSALSGLTMEGSAAYWTRT